ncbi:MAG: 50S ribosomal protein L18, partial [Metallosphaera sp.]
VIVQFMRLNPKGDITVSAAHSTELRKFGWKGDENNSSACYLTGYLAGMRAKKSGITKATADIGLFTPTVGARVFYALKGAIDSGVEIPIGDVQVSNDRIVGKHVAEYAKKIEQEDPEKYKRIFSRYILRGLDPKDLPSHFKDVLSSIKGEK